MEDAPGRRDGSGPIHNGFLPKTWVEATEKYGSQTSVDVLPNGHYVLKNYHGGTPFPNPSDPNKGWKVLANVFWAFVPALYANTPDNYGAVWALDRFGNISPETFDVVYRWSSYITDAGFPPEETYAPGTWYTEWGMQETPEQARYTASLALYYKDQEANPFADTYVFVPALRRSLRLSTSSRCSPVFGLDWSYDDAKTNGFNASTSIYTGDFLGDRKILTLAKFNQDGANFPDGYLMPLAWPKPSWGTWESARWLLTTFTASPVKRRAIATPTASSTRTKNTGTATGLTCSTPTTSCGNRLRTSMTSAWCPRWVACGTASPRWRGIFKHPCDGMVRIRQQEQAQALPRRQRAEGILRRRQVRQPRRPDADHAVVIRLKGT